MTAIQPSSGNPTTIVYAHSSALVGGGNVVLLRLFSMLPRDRFRPISVIPEHGPLEDQLARLHVPLTILDIRPLPRRRLTSLWTLVRLRLWSRQHRAALVHANDLGMYRELSRIKRQRDRVCHIHHPDVSSAGLAWSFQRPPAAVLVPTRHVGDKVREALPRPDAVPVHVVGNPIDTAWFSPATDVAALRERLGLRLNHRHVSMVSSMSRHKGHECFLRMAKQIIGVIPEMTFSIVGGFTTEKREYAAELTSLASQLGITEQVRFWGYVDDATARDIIASSDLFVLPTHEEGFGVVIAEAQACGVPVLTSSIQPLPEIVREGESAYLLDPDDDKEFARLAIEILDDPARQQRMGQAGRAFVEQRFSLQAYAERVMSVYESIRASRPRANDPRRM